jgi:glycosyltransferase involved in cell wall biosynthesis
MRIVITTTQVPFVDGGAETHARSLQKVLKEKGHEAEIVSIPFKWYPPERIHEHLLACRLLDLEESNGVPVDRLIGLKFPAYHIRHPNKVTWILHQFRTAFEMWDTGECDLSPYPHGRAVRDSIDAVERALLPEARFLYANSATVAKRLHEHCALEATPLYHPPENASAFHSGSFGDYLYFPSRINKWKRQHLAIEALAGTRQPVRLVFSGSPDNPQDLETLKARVGELKLGKRVQFLGRIPFAEMVSQYASSRGVLFIPEQEDYGYITLEAMLSSKPVITCKDSGGPTEFIRDGREGFVSDPTPESLAKAMDEIWASASFAREAGARARQRYDEMEINWDHVVRMLLK